MQNKEMQMFISAAFAGLMYYLGIVVIPIIMLIFAMIVDYITGMSAAWYNAELSSKKGIKGIVKKSRLPCTRCCSNDNRLAYLTGLTADKC